MGVHYSPGDPGVRNISRQAAELSFAPVLLGVESFFKLIEIAGQSGILLIDVRVQPGLSEVDEVALAQKIYDLRLGGFGAFRAFLLNLLRRTEASIEYVTFQVPSGNDDMRVTIYSSGTIYVDQDEQALSRMDRAVSEVADYRPGYEV